MHKSYKMRVARVSKDKITMTVKVDDDHDGGTVVLTVSGSSRFNVEEGDCFTLSLSPRELDLDEEEPVEDEDEDDE